MSLVLTLNAGSSSVRLGFVDVSPEPTLASVKRFNSHGSDKTEMLRRFTHGEGSVAPSILAHRIVHGGARWSGPALLDAEAEAYLETLVPLAPLHLPGALAWLRAAREVFPRLPQIGVFDTAYFSALPRVAATYAIPRALTERYGLRRFGFHGLAHAAMQRRWRQLRPDLPAGGRVISLQLGSGCSAAAVHRGRPLDTSMGFSPTEGLMMATRSGDIDPGLVTFLQRSEGLDPAATDRLLTESSGLLGVSGLTEDMEALCNSAEPAAKFAIEVYCYRIRKYVGAYAAVLNGLDGILLGGGVGEHSGPVRAQCLAGLDFLGIEIDARANDAAIREPTCISRPAARVGVWVIPVDEETEMARIAAAHAG
jgi:acetate kinase